MFLHFHVFVLFQLLGYNLEQALERTLIRTLVVLLLRMGVCGQIW